jgi:diacylglycerol kinase family enzyme
MVEMRVCLYYNETAGEGTGAEEISRLITKAGHQVARIVRRGEPLAGNLKDGVDAVVAAGGDGTVASAGRVLAGGKMPLAILPLGTANNIATALGINEQPDAAVAAWTRQRIVQIDVGVVEDRRGHCYFIEGVGVGLIPEGINASRKMVSKDAVPTAEDRLEQARQIFRETLQGLQPRPYGVRIEGESIDNDALLVEVLNITTVGPRIRLSPDANPADGLLSVVVAGAADRDAIAAHLRAPWDDDDSHARLPSWRASRIEVTGWHDYHVDDDVRSAEGETVTIRVEPGFLPVLA